MKNEGKKRNRVLLIVGGVLLACAVLSLGAAAVGGAVFALTRGAEQHGPLTADVSLAVPSRATLDSDEPGVVIAGVVADGPAAKAGVERGDILLALDGEAVNSQAELIDALDTLNPGDEVELRVLHGDEGRRLTASLGEQGDRAYLGVVPCCPMQEGVSIHRVVDVVVGGGGARITEVVDGSPADEAGLTEGDVILAVDGETLGKEVTLVDAIGAHEPGDRVTLEVRSPSEDESRELSVELGEHPEKEGVAYLGVTYAPVDRGHPFPRPEMPRWLPHRDGSGEGPHFERFGHVAPEGLPRVTVVAVDPDSPAEEAGIREGDVILSIDGDTVHVPHEVTAAVTGAEPGDTLSMTIRRLEEGDDPAEELKLSATLGEHPEDEERAYLGVRLGFHGIQLRRFGGEWDAERWRREHELPERWELPFDLEELPEHWGLPFDPEELPEHWELPFDLEELPEQFHFEWPPGDDVDHQEFIPGTESV